MHGKVTGALKLIASRPSRSNSGLRRKSQNAGQAAQAALSRENPQIPTDYKNVIKKGLRSSPG
jgi:hypothetical protein